ALSDTMRTSLPRPSLVAAPMECSASLTGSPWEANIGLDTPCITASSAPTTGPISNCVVYARRFLMPTTPANMIWQCSESAA
ncbi:hypothetical protein BG011_002770, partial [Mortierella polycephala]